jgi:hypothetical protein
MAATDASAAADAPLTMERRETGVELIVTKACTTALSKQAHERMRNCMISVSVQAAVLERGSADVSELRKKTGCQRSLPWRLLAFALICS